MSSENVGLLNKELSGIDSEYSDRFCFRFDEAKHGFLKATYARDVDYFSRSVAAAEISECAFKGGGPTIHKELKVGR